jgi:hypothetical protein
MVTDGSRQTTRAGCGLKIFEFAWQQKNIRGFYPGTRAGLFAFIVQDRASLPFRATST